MKRCPECMRDYTNETLNFCLDDGAALLDGPAVLSEPGAVATGALSEPATEIIPEFQHAAPDDGNPSESQTIAKGRTTDRTAVYRTEAPPPDSLGVPSERQSLSAHRSAEPKAGARGWVSNPQLELGGRKKLLLGALAALLFLLIGSLGYQFLRSANVGGRLNSIAVLPFQNRSGDPNSEYLSDGLAESLIYRLTQLPNLKVSPTSSVIRYKGKDTDVAKIASELGVDAVMTGRLAQIGDNLTISVELVDVANNQLLWGEQYDRKIADLLTTQREIAAMIAEKLQLKLSGDESKSITKKYTDNNEAYQCYLRGRFYLAKRTANDTQKSIDQYQRATEIDPKFALAFAGLAEATHFLAIYSYPQVTELYPRAKEIALKAIELDNSLAEPHSILGIMCFLDHDFACMEREQKLAIQLNPNYSEAHRRLALVLRSVGRIEEARVETKRALEIDPLSPVTNFQYAQEFFFERKYQESEALSKKNIELDPNVWYAHLQLFNIYRTKRDYVSAVDELAKMQDSRGEPDAAKFIRESFVNGDWTGFLKKITADRTRLKIYPYFVATFFAELGEKDKAFATLNEAVEAKDQHTNQMKMDPLRDDPHFQDVLRRAGIPN